MRTVTDHLSRQSISELLSHLSQPVSQAHHSWPPRCLPSFSQTLAAAPLRLWTPPGASQEPSAADPCPPAQRSVSEMHIQARHCPFSLQGLCAPHRVTATAPSPDPWPWHLLPVAYTPQTEKSPLALSPSLLSARMAQGQLNAWKKGQGTGPCVECMNMCTPWVIFAMSYFVAPSLPVSDSSKPSAASELSRERRAAGGSSDGPGRSWLLPAPSPGGWNSVTLLLAQSDVTGPQQLVFPRAVGGLGEVNGRVTRRCWRHDEAIGRETVLF